MEKTRCRHHAGEKLLDRFDLRFLEITKGTVGKNEPDIQANQRAASAKHETHEAADRAVFLHPFSIVNPNERKVLNVVEYFEQGDSSKNIGHAVITIPPEGNAGREQG